MHHISTRKLLTRISTTIVVCAALLATTACSTSTITEGNPDKPVGQIIPATLAIVHTGGIDGAFERSDTSIGIAGVAGIAHSLEDEGYDVLVLDSGNTMGGSPSVDLTDGEDAVGFLNAAGYDALALGSRELALGAPRLAKRVAQSDFAYLSADVDFVDEDMAVETTRRTFALSDGRLVGVFGLTAPHALDDLQPLATSSFAIDEDELVQTAQQEVAALREAGCRLVICLSNLGSTADDELSATDLAARVSGIDILLDGGSDATTQRSVTDASGEEMLVVQTASGLSSLATITWERGTISAKIWDVSEPTVADEQVDALVTQSAAEFGEWLDQELAQSKKALPAEGARTGNVGLGKLAATAILWDTQRSSDQKVDAALITASLLQDSLPKGAITRGDALAVFPHEQTRLCTIQLTGAELQQVLAPILQKKPEASDDMPQVAGVTIAAPSTTESTTETPAAKDATDSAEKSDSQKQDTRKEDPRIASVANRTFSPSDTYTIVTCETLVAPQGALHAFLSDTATLTDLDTSAGKALIAYLQHECKKGIDQSFFD